MLKSFCHILPALLNKVICQQSTSPSSLAVLVHRILSERYLFLSKTSKKKKNTSQGSTQPRRTGPLAEPTITKPQNTIPSHPEQRQKRRQKRTTGRRNAIPIPTKLLAHPPVLLPNSLQHRRRLCNHHAPGQSHQERCPSTSRRHSGIIFQGDYPGTRRLHRRLSSGYQQGCTWLAGVRRRKQAG